MKQLLISILALGLFYSCQQTPKEENQTDDKPTSPNDLFQCETEMPIFLMSEAEGINQLILRIETMERKQSDFDKPIDKIKIDLSVEDAFKDELFRISSAQINCTPPLVEGAVMGRMDFPYNFNKYSPDYAQIMNMFGRNDLTVKVDVKSVVFTDGEVFK